LAAVLGLQGEPVSDSVDVEAQLRVILKSHDRIGFGRRGVLDAEQEIRRFAAALSKEDHARFRGLVVSWIDKATAQQVSTLLHYNLPEHVQALAIHLCGSVPIPESQNLLRRVQAGGAFETDEEQVCREALDHSIAVLNGKVTVKPPRNGL
jgi:hypothetical protein